MFIVDDCFDFTCQVVNISERKVRTSFFEKRKKDSG